MTTSNLCLYDQDLYLWWVKTADLLKQKRFEELDLENLIEEIESMGKRERRELANRLTTIIEHLLKLSYWTEVKEENARGWRVTIVEQRRQIIRLLGDSPSFKTWLEEIFLECYEVARKDTIKANKLPENIFTIQPFFTLQELLNPDCLPE
jgi:hypothetical protein